MLIGVLVATTYIFLPGFVILCFLGFGKRSSLILSPLTSVSYLGVVAIVYDFLGWRTSPITAFVPIVVALLVIATLRWKMDGRPLIGESEKLKNTDWKLVALYAIVGIIIGYFVYLRSIGSISSINERYDVVFHLNTIRSFSITGKMSSLNHCIYVNGEISPSQGGSGFYPCAFHELAALVEMTTRIGVTASANIVNYVFAAIVLPLSLLSLLSLAFYDRKTLVCGAFVSGAFVSFPWGLLIWGPLYPNAASFCTLLSLVSIGIILIRSNTSQRDRFIIILVGIVDLIGVLLLQANVAFAAGIMFAAYIFFKLLYSKKSVSFRGKRIDCRVMAVTFLVVCCLIWMILIRLPLMRGIVSFNWASWTNLKQALVNILLLTFIFGIEVSFPQYVLAALVLAGFIKSIYYKKDNWIAAAYLLSCIIYIVDSTSEGPLKHVLAGPWYSDPYRIAAMATLFAMPLAASALSSLATVSMRVVDATRGVSPGRKTFFAMAVPCGLFLIFNYFPSFLVPGDNFSLQVKTAFGYTREEMNHVYNIEGTYTNKESSFVKKAQEIIGDDNATVINCPYDGSNLSFGIDGLRVYYRTMSAFQDEQELQSETPESRLIREHLCDISTRQDVRDAVQTVGARYVIILSESQGKSYGLDDYFDEDDWKGVNSIDEDTPGFRLLLSEDGYSLYEIVDVS